MQISSSWGRKGYQTESRASEREGKKSSSSDLLPRDKHFPYVKDGAKEIEDKFERMEKEKLTYVR